MTVAVPDIWLCSTCTLLAVNGEHDPDTTPEEDARLEEKLSELGPHLVPVSGTIEFSNVPCDCCGETVAGERQEFAILGEPA